MKFNKQIKIKIKKIPNNNNNNIYTMKINRIII